MVTRAPLRTLLLLGSALCWPISVRAGAPSPALPQNGQFVAGQGQIAAGAKGVTITQSSPRGVIDWQSFSVGRGQSVQFQNGGGATLNEVTGNLPSIISGSLTGTGSVYLVNPQGVVISKSGAVNTGGNFVASTQGTDASRFIANGGLALAGGSQAGVTNLGQINAGGGVALVGNSVTNAGSVTAAGDVTLAAGSSLVLQARGDGTLVSVSGPQGPGGDVRNTGNITAANAALESAGGNVYALAGNRSGFIHATGTTTRNGRVLLEAEGETEVTNTITANGSQGTGGQGTGGQGKGGQGKGGQIVVTGRNVVVGSTAVITASGSAKGGTILIGGDRAGGGNPATKLVKASIPNAQTTSVARGAVISANGGTGSGGNVVVWSEQATSFLGQIAATGNTGGFAEISSHGVLNFNGHVDLRGANGTVGTVLLDPADVVITDAAVSPGQSAISPEVINTELAFSNVAIIVSGGSGNGDIFVNEPLTWNSSNALTLSAYRNVTISAPITAGQDANVTVTADNTNTGNGLVSFSGAGVINLAGNGQATITTSFGAGNTLFNNGDYSNVVIGGAGFSTWINISNATQLAGLWQDANLGGSVTANFNLLQDIDLSAVSFTPATNFVSTFNGNGHTISNLTVNSPANYFASFIQRNYGTIENVNFSNANVTGLSFNGIVAGLNFGTIQNVTITGTATAVGTGVTAVVGGVAGSNLGTISNVSFNGTVTGSYDVGGVAGLSGGEIGGDGHVIISFPAALVSQADVAATVSGGTWSGGVVGQNFAGASITNSKFSGTVGGTSAAGIAAVNYGNIANTLTITSGNGVTDPVAAVEQTGAVISNAFYDSSVYGAHATNGTGVTDADVMALNISGLSASVWAVQPGAYPTPFQPYTGPAASPAISISGTVSGTTGVDTVGLVAGGTFYGPITTSTSGAWSFTLPVASLGSNDLVATLLTGGTATTLVTGIGGSTASAPLAANTLTLNGVAPGAQTLSLLLGTQASVENYSTSAIFLPASTAAMGGSNLAVSVPGSLTIAQDINTTGNVSLTAAGINATGSINSTGFALASPNGDVALSGPNNIIGTISGSTGAFTYLGASDVTLAGLVANGNVAISVAGAVAVVGPVSAVGSGDALTIAADSFSETVGANALSVRGGGRWLVYLPALGAASLTGLVGGSVYNIPAGGSVPGSDNDFVYAFPPPVIPSGGAPTPTPTPTPTTPDISLVSTHLVIPPVQVASYTPPSQGPATLGGSVTGTVISDAVPSGSVVGSTPSAAPPTAPTSPVSSASAPSSGPTGAQPSAATESPSGTVSTSTPSASPTASAPSGAAASGGGTPSNVATGGAASGNLAGLSALAEASGAPNIFNAALNAGMAGGLSPEQALAAAQAAMQQLAESSTRSGTPTASESLGDAVAQGLPLTDPAIALALASGISPAQALAQVAALNQAQMAELSTASVAQSAGAQQSGSLSQGDASALATAVNPSAAKRAAGLLASGLDPDTSLAAALRTQESEAEMAANAEVPLDPTAASTIGLAAGEDSGNPAVVVLLAMGFSPSEAQDIAARTDSASAAQAAAAQSHTTDPIAVSLLGGQVPAGYQLAMRDGDLVLVADAAAAQIALAQSEGNATDKALADGLLPPELLAQLAKLPGFTSAFAQALARGMSPPQALTFARRQAEAAKVQAATAQLVTPDDLDQRLLSSKLDAEYVRNLAGTRPLSWFDADFGRELASGAAPWQAVRDAFGVVPADIAASLPPISHPGAPKGADSDPTRTIP